MGTYPPECPLDRQEVPYGKVHTDRAIELKVQALHVRCKNFCDWTGELKFLDDHKEVCPLEFIECSNDGCRTPVRRNNLGKHVSQECDFRVLSCVYCTDAYVYKDEQKHLAACMSVHVECVNGCPTKYIRRDQVCV